MEREKLTGQEIQEIDRLEEKEKAGTLTPEETERYDALLNRFWEENLIHFGRDDRG